VSKIESYPAGLRPGQRLFLHGSGWGDAEVRIEGRYGAPIARVLRGKRTERGVAPERGAFSVTLQTNAWPVGDVALIVTGGKGERAGVKVKVEKWLDRKPNGKRASKAHWRAEWMFRRRFRNIGYVPEGLRLVQVVGVERARKAREELHKGRKLYFTPASAGGCAWTPLGAAPVQRELPLGDASNAPSSGRAIAIAVHPDNPEVLYLGTASGGLWTSTDGGFNWEPRSDAWASAAVGDIAIAPQDSQVVVAGTGEYSSSSFYTGTGVMVSHDGGATWAERGHATLAGFSVSRVVFDPTDASANTVYVASDAGIFKANLQSDAWQQIDSRSSSDLVLVSGGAARRLLAGIDTRGVFESTEGTPGAFGPFQQLHAPPADFGRVALSRAANRPGTIWAAFAADRSSALLSRSLDDGASWLPIGGGPAVGNTWYTWTLCAHPDDDEIVYLGETFLKRRESDGSWTTVANQQLLQGFTTGIHVDQQAVFISPADAQRIWVCNDGGLWHSSDGGKNFFHRNAGLATLQNTHFMSHPDHEALLFAGSQDNGAFISFGSPIWRFSATGDAGMVGFDRSLSSFYESIVTHDIARSDSFGRKGTYQRKTAGLDTSLPVEWYPPFVVDPRSERLCWFGDTKLWRTTSGGDSWTAVTDSLPASMTTIEPHPTDDAIVFVGTWQGEVYRIERTGASWTPGKRHCHPSSARRLRACTWAISR
jgi:photosystem II stability/assembly factor-like uncharacterized protein